MKRVILILALTGCATLEATIARHEWEQTCGSREYATNNVYYLVACREESAARRFSQSCADANEEYTEIFACAHLYDIYVPEELEKSYPVSEENDACSPCAALGSVEQIEYSEEVLNAR